MQGNVEAAACLAHINIAAWRRNRIYDIAFARNKLRAVCDGKSSARQTFTPAHNLPILAHRLQAVQLIFGGTVNINMQLVSNIFYTVRDNMNIYNRRYPLNLSRFATTRLCLNIFNFVQNIQWYGNNDVNREACHFETLNLTWKARWHFVHSIHC